MKIPRNTAKSVSLIQNSHREYTARNNGLTDHRSQRVGNSYALKLKPFVLAEILGRKSKIRRGKNQISASEIGMQTAGEMKFPVASKLR